MAAHSPCPYVSCGSSDAFNWNPDGYGMCHSCHTSYPAKGMGEVYDWVKSEYPLKERRNIMTTEIASGTFEGIRGIDQDVCKLYGIQIQKDAEGNSVRYAFKYPDNIKYRGFSEKKFWYKDKGFITDLFGPPVNAGTSKRLYLTEGEFDAASLYQILGKTFPVLSLPSSTISDKFLKKNQTYLNSFDELVYGGELDDAGRAAADKLYTIFPEKFYYVTMTKHKDANDFLMAGDEKDLMWAARKPQRYTPENFFTGDEAVNTAITTENPYEYVPTGHTGIDSYCRGMVKGGLTFIKAPRGAGKTELIRYFEIALLKAPDTVIAGLHMEEMKSTTYRAMATYELGINVRTKDDAKEAGISEEKVVEAAQRATKGERTVLFEMRGSDDPLELLHYVRLAATVYGASFIFVDHVQRLAYLSSSGVDGATSLLTTLGSCMAQLAKELNIGVIFISQVNDDGRTKYAAALEEEAIICIKLERDTESEDEVERNTTELVFDKNRPFSKLGNAGSLYYDPDTTILREFF